MDPEETAPNTEKDICYGVIYNSKNETVEMETARLPIYRGGERAPMCIFEETIWQCASLRRAHDSTEAFYNKGGKDSYIETCMH